MTKDQARRKDDCHPDQPLQWEDTAGAPLAATPAAGQAGLATDLQKDIGSIADELEDAAAPYAGDFADTVNGCTEALRQIASRAGSAPTIGCSGSGKCGVGDMPCLGCDNCPAAPVAAATEQAPNLTTVPCPCVAEGSVVGCDNCDGQGRLIVDRRDLAPLATPAATNIVQDVASLFAACGFEVRPDAGQFTVSGSLDAAGVLIDAVIEHFHNGAERFHWSKKGMVLHPDGFYVHHRRSGDCNLAATPADAGQPSADELAADATALADTLRNHHAVDDWCWDDLINAADMITKLLARLSTSGAPVPVIHAAHAYNSDAGPVVHSLQVTSVMSHPDGSYSVFVDLPPAPVTAEPAKEEAIIARVQAAICDANNGADIYMASLIAARWIMGDLAPAPADRDAIRDQAQSLIGKLMGEVSELEHLYPTGSKEPGALLRQSDVWRVLVEASKSMERAADAAETRDAKGGEQ